MTLKQTIPSYICCANIGLGYLVASLIVKQKGLKRDETLKSENLAARPDGYLTIVQDGRTVSVYQLGERQQGYFVIQISSTADIQNRLCEPVVPVAPPIQVAGETLRHDASGVRVGRIQVPWETVRQIAALDPSKRPA